MSNGKVLYCGSVDASDYEKFLRRARLFLAEAQKRKGNERSAAHNEQGHQKTPVGRNYVLESFW
jgi:hypothetical protein